VAFGATSAPAVAPALLLVTAAAFVFFIIIRRPVLLHVPHDPGFLLGSRGGGLRSSRSGRLLAVRTGGGRRGRAWRVDRRGRGRLGRWVAGRQHTHALAAFSTGLAGEARATGQAAWQVGRGHVQAQPVQGGRLCEVARGRGVARLRQGSEDCAYMSPAKAVGQQRDVQGSDVARGDEVSPVVVILVRTGAGAGRWEGGRVVEGEALGREKEGWGWG